STSDKNTERLFLSETIVVDGAAARPHLVVVRGVGVRAVHLVAVVGEDVAEARPALLGHRDGRAEVALHLRTRARGGPVAKARAAPPSGGDDFPLGSCTTSVPSAPERIAAGTERFKVSGSSVATRRGLGA
ncbi:jg23941, partial [Pararge aegeria aegeria]